MLNPHELSIRLASLADEAGIWQVLEPNIRAGETVPLDRELSRGAALAHWLAPRTEVYVAEQEGTILGSYSLRARQGGGGAHIATSVYLVSPSATGRGIAQAMGEHSLARARELDFSGLSLDFVISTDERRLKLWQRSGFEVVGRLPKAFQHPTAGLVDVLTLFRGL